MFTVENGLSSQKHMDCCGMETALKCLIVTCSTEVRCYLDKKVKHTCNQATLLTHLPLNINCILALSSPC